MFPGLSITIVIVIELHNFNYSNYITAHLCKMFCMNPAC